MKNFIDIARSRRSIRSYTTQQISREELELCVEAALNAPSACNSQPWKFIIVDDENKKKLISEKVLSGFYNMNTFASKASAFIIVIAGRTKPPAWLGQKLRGTDFKKIDIGIACQNLSLQAWDMGIGSCMLGWFNERELKKILSVPRGKKAELIIALGYPEPGELPEKHMKDRSETVGFNKY